MEDRRIKKSKQVIENAFLELLKKKDINKISVVEICDIANVGRGTFYLHYLDIYDLYEKIEDKLYLGLANLFEECFPTTNEKNGEKLINGILSYVEDNKEMFLLLMKRNNNLQKLKNVFNKKVIKENNLLHQNNNLKYDEVESIFVVSGMVGVLEQWLKDNMHIAKDEIANMLNKILCKINNQ